MVYVTAENNHMAKTKKRKTGNSIAARIKRAAVPKVLYTIKDPNFPDFEVLFTDNAWWASQAKVGKLIDAFKLDCSINEACVYAGITSDQWLYFVEKHPDFYRVKELISELPTLRARQEVVIGLANDKEFALKYLERKRKNEFSLRTESLHGEDPKNKFTSLADALKALELSKTNKDEPQA